MDGTVIIALLIKLFIFLSCIYLKILNNNAHFLKNTMRSHNHLYINNILSRMIFIIEAIYSYYLILDGILYISGIMPK